MTPTTYAFGAAMILLGAVGGCPRLLTGVLRIMIYANHYVISANSPFYLHRTHIPNGPFIRNKISTIIVYG